jgi:methanogenic corrinoid protein MtbC1
MVASGTDDGLYPMRVATRMTGLSSHTIRVWERRYGAVVPHRTEGNTRRYSPEDVKKLQLLRQARDQGYPIGEIAGLTIGRLEEMVRRERVVDRSPEGPPTESTDPYAHIRAQYLDRITTFDYYPALETLARAAALLPTAEFVFEILLPILRETGDRWESGSFSVAHEHAVSAQVRGLLDSLLRLASPQPGAPRVVLATPAGHQHEFGVMAAAYLAVARGLEPVYLGPDVPGTDLEQAITISRAGLILLAVEKAMDAGEARRFDALLVKLTMHCDVWVGLPGDHDARGRVDGVRYFHRFEDLDLALTERAVRAEP